MRLYAPHNLVRDPGLADNEAWGRVLFSIPWLGKRWGLVVLLDGRWFLGIFARGDR
jgi:hypothetical protein